MNKRKAVLIAAIVLFPITLPCLIIWIMGSLLWMGFSTVLSDLGWKND